MTANHDLERRLADQYAHEGTVRAPDWVLGKALATIQTTSQRRALVRVPWRFPTMNNTLRLAVAAVAVIAVAGIGLALTGRFAGVGGSGGQATPTPSPTIGPSPTPSATPLPTAPPLSETFTSRISGISVAHPAGWTPQAATEPWASADLNWSFGSPAVDFLFDPGLGKGQLFVGVASQPLGGASPTQWVDRMLAIPDPEPCAQTEPIEVDGAAGRLASCNEPLRAFVTDGQRGYAIFLYRSGDKAWVPDVYNLDFFKSLLQRVQLRPADAAAASPSPS